MVTSFAYIHTNERMKDFNGVASTKIIIVLPVVGGIFNGQGVGYFIHLLCERTLRPTLIFRNCSDFFL
jgi:hypothetical protein